MEREIEEYKKRLAEAESKLAQFEERCEAMFKHRTDEIHIWKLVKDENGRILDWTLEDANPTACESWQIEKEDAIGKTPDVIFGEGGKQQFLPIVNQIFDTGETLDWEEYFEPTNQYLKMSATPMNEQFIVIGRDISQETLRKKALELSEDFLLRTGEIAKVGGWQISGDFEILHSTKITRDIHEVEDDAVLTVAEAIEFYHPDDREMVTDVVDKAIEKGESYTFEARFITAKGNQKWVFAKGEPEMVNGKCVRLSGIFQDITDRKEAELALEARTRQFFNVADNVPGVVMKYKLNTDGTDELLYLSEGSIELFEISAEEALKDVNKIWSMVHEEDAKRMVPSIQKSAEELSHWDFEYRLMLPDQRMKWLQLSGVPEKQADGSVVWDTIAIDITQRKVAQFELEKRNQQLSAFTNNLPGVLLRYKLNQDGTDQLLYISEGSMDLFEIEADKVIENVQLIWDLIIDEHVQLMVPSIQESAVNLSLWEYECQIELKDQRTKWIKFRGLPIQHSDGSVVWDTIGLDISKQKDAEFHLEDRNKQLSTFSDNLPGVILRYRLNADGTDEIVYVNEGVTQWFDLTAEEAMKDIKLVWAQIHEDDVKQMVPSIQQSAKALSRWVFEFRIIHPQHPVKWMKLVGTPTKMSDGSVEWDTIGIDITGQKNAEKALEDINERLERMVEVRAQKAIELSKELELYLLAAEHAGSGVWYYDVSNKTLKWDSIMYELYGINRKDFSGAFDAWTSCLHPEDKKSAIMALNDAIDHKSDYDTLYKIVNPRTNKINYIRAKGKVELDENGEVKAIYGTNWSVNREMKLAFEKEMALKEVQGTQMQLYESEKMATLGILTAGVAHELNNPLNFILGGYKVIKKRLKNKTQIHKDELEESLEWIKTGAERASKIVEGLNLFSRQNKDFNEDCDMHQIVDDCLLMLQNKYKNNVEIIKQYHPNGLHIEGNNGRLHQAILNLLANSVEAIGEKGCIEIETVDQNDRVSISITDNGSGISKENLKKIMDPFFSTKPPGQGTGLGLSITHSIIQEHHGKLNFKSELGKGTKVMISLPKKHKEAS